MLRQIRLIVCDLDYLVFDCSALKARALRDSLIPFADAIPHDMRLPDEVDAEEGFRDHGFHWTRFLELGLDEETLEQLHTAYRVHEERLAGAGIGRLYPGIEEFLGTCRKRGALAAIGAEAGREYLLAVSDRHGLDNLFDLASCSEEFGMGSADEMIEEIMRRSEVNPSETLALGTRPGFFRAARNNDVVTIGCGWGLRGAEALAEADLQALSLETALMTIEEADARVAQDFA